MLEAGRHGAPERGFSMAMDSIRGDCEHDTLFVLARDGDGAVRGVLHFVPCYGRRRCRCRSCAVTPTPPTA